MNKFLIILVFFTVSGVLAAVTFIYSGIYNVSALRQHTRIVYDLLQLTMQESVERRAKAIVAPDLEERELLEVGLREVRQHCVQCHGAPGVPPEDFAKGMTPVPPSLVQMALDLAPEEMFWVVKNGIKLTGMPAWGYRMPDEDIWAIVAFVEHAPRITPARYRAMVEESASARPSSEPDTSESDGDQTGRTARDAQSGDPERGKVAIQQYACTTCHVIPGVVGADAHVGPSLARIGERTYLAGVVPNTPGNMILWLQRPQEIDPLTAMPDLGVTEQHARDIAAYLYGLD